MIEPELLETLHRVIKLIQDESKSISGLEEVLLKLDEVKIKLEKNGKSGTDKQTQRK